MRYSGWTTLMGTCMLATVACSGPPRTSASPSAGAPASAGAPTTAAAPTSAGAPMSAGAPTRTRTTLGGVYTAAQAARGQDTYEVLCRGCHTPASHTGATFTTWWSGQLVSDLFSYIGQSMPDNDPGSLAPEESADLVAYLLSLNAMPPGTIELPPDSAALSTIRIQAVAKP